MQNEERITYFAETDSRNKRAKFGIRAKDRTRHVYVIGKTGMGKSTLLENMAIQDLHNDEGMAFIDPHGKTAEFLLEFVPEHRIKDVLYFAPFDIENPISFNLMEDVGPDKRHLVVSGLMSAFKKLFGEESFSDRMQYILQNTILALLEYPGATMLGINRMLTDKDYRKKVVANVTDTSVKAYWEQEFANYTERFAAEATPAIQNKIGQFTSNPLIRNIIGQPKSSFNIRQIMDEGKIIILNLSKGKVGEANANLLGSMLITKIYLAAMSRADIPERELQKLPNFYLYVDEFQSFANESFANILSEARKYRLNLTIAHQYIEQMSEEVRAAVFGNVGTMIAFRVGSFDAEVLEKEFAPQFTVEDLVNLGFAQIYLKLMIDGVSSTPFSARTLLPIASGEKDHTLEIIEASRNHFAQKRAFVEEAIISWQAEDSKNSSSGTKNDSKAKTSSGSYDKNAKKSDSTSSNSSAASNSSSYKKNNNVSSSEPYKGKTYEKTQPKQENKPFKDALKQEVTPEKLDQIKATENNSSVQSKTDLAQTLSHFIAKEKAPAPPKEKTDNSIDTKPQSIGASKSFNNSNTSIGSGADSLTTPPHRPKQPSKENVNQLKDALKDILKDAHKQDKKIDTKENSGQPKVLDDHDKQLKNLEQKVADIEQSRKTNSNSNSVNPNSPNPSKENNSITQKKTEATSPGVENSNNSKSSEGFGHKKSVVSNHTSTVHIQKTQASSHVPDEKKEVPEHVLRKVLDTNNAK